MPPQRNMLRSDEIGAAFHWASISRGRQIRGIKSEAVVVYCKPLITKKMGYYRLS
ncbi:MAG: hypothetical protein JRF31_13320 [Deltaproteobacteria bacterium]|nr:hypothetical protein [Deltaproteobacteria bacterium]MBW1958214.1 hypothetical protein [Deltaproteobacteria bacterium]MBW2013177.1 hypothetical protein [Deltaproteobacteria bacterium]MBW2090134.1 hypothetical protein [Deltaproteobacteria bacterium]MBW2321778.1 hypothetical protein [Deltaproteobacteria bacterium]